MTHQFGIYFNEEVKKYEDEIVSNLNDGFEVLVVPDLKRNPWENQKVRE